MWLLVARQPLPDAPYWPGRRLFAAVDAVAWPAAWVLLVQVSPWPLGIVGVVVTAWAVWAGLGRMRHAVWFNHRYRFTTWRWGRRLVAVLVFGAVIKLALS